MHVWNTYNKLYMNKVPINWLMNNNLLLRSLKQNSNMLQDVIVVGQHQQYLGVDLAYG